MSKWLLDDQPAPAHPLARFRGLGETCRTQARDDVVIIIWRRCQIKYAIAPGATLLFKFGEHLTQVGIGRGVVKLALHIVDAFREGFPQLRRIGLTSMLLDAFLDIGTKHLVGPR